MKWSARMVTFARKRRTDDRLAMPSFAGRLPLCVYRWLRWTLRKVYLSPMIDCFDGLVVSSTIDTGPDAALVNTMLDAAIETVSSGGGYAC
jgi:transposase InsO family protein